MGADQPLAHGFDVVKGQERDRRDSGASHSVEVEALRLRNEVKDQRQDGVVDEKSEKEAEVGVLGNR